MSDPHDLDGQRSSYRPGFRFFLENERTLRWYADRVVDATRRRGAKSVLGLGIGQRLVCGRLIEELRAGGIERYAIVEGSGAAIGELESLAGRPAGLTVHEAWFERFATEERFDLIEMGFVLEHVDDPEALLKRYRELLRPLGALAIAVPNARSLHRLIGHAAGLLDDVQRLSAEDHALGHQRYFDLAALDALVSACGLAVERREGIFLKPLTTGQLERLDLPPAVLEALFRVGVELPGIANAIYVEAVRS